MQQQLVMLFFHGNDPVITCKGFICGLRFYLRHISIRSKIFEWWTSLYSFSLISNDLILWMTVDKFLVLHLMHLILGSFSLRKNFIRMFDVTFFHLLRFFFSYYYNWDKGSTYPTLFFSWTLYISWARKFFLFFVLYI